MLRFEVLEPQAYRKALLAAIPYAKKRIVLQTMVILWGKQTDAILAAIAKAAERGVQIHIIYDVYSRLPYEHVQGIKPASIARMHLKKTLKILDELQSIGVRVSRIGKIGVNYFKGRCHVKSFVVDNDVYSFGGINFSHPSFGSNDYMLHARGQDLADCITQLSEKIVANKPPLNNGQVSLDAHTAILFDGGRPRHSLIYDHACQLAAKAASILYVSQMVPSGRLARLLVPGRYQLYYNPPNALPTPASWAQAFDEQRYRTHNSYQRDKYIHAKFILYEMPDGSRALLSGSHNFSYRGVAYGTQELALYSTNEGLWQKLYDFTQKHIA